MLHPDEVAVGAAHVSDMLVLPFAPGELAARLKLVARRAQASRRLLLAHAVEGTGDVSRPSPK